MRRRLYINDEPIEKEQDDPETLFEIYVKQKVNEGWVEHGMR